MEIWKLNAVTQAYNNLTYVVENYHILDHTTRWNRMLQAYNHYLKTLHEADVQTSGSIVFVPTETNKYTLFLQE